MLVPYGIVPHALTLLAEGKANTNYRIETASGPLVLRIHQRDARSAVLERTILGCLPVAFPAPWIVVRGKGFTVFEFREGMSLERALAKGRDFPAEKTAGDLAQARLVLNERRCAAAGLFVVPEPEPVACRIEELRIDEPWSSAIEGLLGWLRHRLPTARLAKPLRERVVRVTDDAEPRLQAIAGPPVLVHGDFKASNLLVDETGLTAVLDWEFAHAGTWLSDVGQLLRHAEGLPPGFETAFLDELNAPEDAALLARTLDLTNLVDFLAGEKAQPTMRADVTRRIDAVCGLYEARFL